ncbi:MAG: head GIN domain-containing protein [Flavobacterium sp.]
MKKIVLLFSLGILAFACNSVSNMAGITPQGPTVTENRETGSFTKLDAHTSFLVKLVHSNKDAVKIEAPENIVPLIETQSKNGELYVGLKSGYNLKNGKGITVTVYFTTLEKIHLSGSGDIVSNDVITNNCAISLNGSGDVTVPVKANRIEVRLQGSGDINVSGSTDALECSLTGSGDIHADKLTSSTTDVTVTGSGDVSTTTTSAITGRITGSGGVSYGGNPAKKDLSVTGSGEFSTF